MQKRNPSIRWWFPSAPVKTHNVLFSYIPFPFLPLPCFISIWVLASHFSFLSGRGWLLITWRAAIFLLKLQSINGGEKWIEGYDFLVEWYRLCCGDENIFVGSGNECFKERNIIVRKMTMWKQWVESYTKEHEGNRRPPFCQHHHQQATLCFSRAHEKKLCQQLFYEWIKIGTTRFRQYRFFIPPQICSVPNPFIAPFLPEK